MKEERLKKRDDPPKFTDEEKNFVYEKSEGKLTVINKASSRNISSQSSNKVNKIISKSTVNNLLFEKFGRPYTGINSVLLIKLIYLKEHYFRMK